MLCQICGQRPATVTIKEIINGKPKVLHLCHICAEERTFFGSDEDLSSLFDSLFPEARIGKGPFQSFLSSFPRGTFRPERVNIFDYFSERAKEVVYQAIEKAKEFKSKYVDTEHLLLGLIEEDVGAKLLEELGVKPADLKSYLEKNIIEGEEEVERPDFSPRAKKVLELAFHMARNLGHNYVGSEHILIGLIQEGEGMAAQVLAKYGLDEEKVSSAVIKLVGKGKGIRRKTATPTLDQYSVDLTGQAKEGKLDPVIGRADEIARVIQVLSRRTKNNPVLIGEPGVGKTAIVEGLAQRIISGNIPETLKDKRVIALDLSGLVAGTKYRGEFEKRMKKILKEIKEAKKNIILFIDELHSVVGAGAAEGAIDASNMLKPALARGDLQTIGATTLDEYRKYIEKDAALERRFQPILVDEPTPDAAIEILRGLRDRYEAHHKVKISDKAIVAAVNLSDRYISDRFLPDKAIDLIDEAAAKVRLMTVTAPEKLKELEKEIQKLKKEKEAAQKVKDKKKVLILTKELKDKKKEKEKIKKQWEKQKGTRYAEVTESDVEEIVSKWTGVPITQISEEETEKLLKLEKRLHERVIGQEEAVKAVAEAIRRGRAGLKDPKRPVGSFIFLGPTGVGKTELAKALAYQLFGDEGALVRIDMSEYMEKHAVSRLVGAPPGYVGYEEGGQLTESVRRKPYSVILLDEIEKAHPDVFNILLQILEDGRLTDSKGKTVDFKNTVIIATSNIGSQFIQDMKGDKLGFGTGKTLKESKRYEDFKNQLLEELRKEFRPEFLNRIDEIIVFHPLTKKQVRQIVDLMLVEVEKLLAGQNIKLEVSERAKNLLAKLGYDPNYGARPLRRVIQKKIENKISDAILSGKFSSRDTIYVDVGKKDEFSFAKKKTRVKKGKTVKAVA